MIISHEQQLEGLKWSDFDLATRTCELLPTVEPGQIISWTSQRDARLLFEVDDYYCYTYRGDGDGPEDTTTDEGYLGDLFIESSPRSNVFQKFKFPRKIRFEPIWTNPISIFYSVDLMQENDVEGEPSEYSFMDQALYDVINFRSYDDPYFIFAKGRKGLPSYYVVEDRGRIGCLRPAHYGLAQTALQYS